MISENPLISSQSLSGSSLEIALHPLVLLTISDYITRHKLRQQKGPIVGALLGQQNGRGISIENAFECLLDETNGETLLNQSWFEERLQQMKDVHKVPQLDLVGWYTVLSNLGPQPAHLSIQRQILQSHNHSTLLLGFHLDSLTDGKKSGKLPLSIYECNLEVDEIIKDSGEDMEMKDLQPQHSLKYRELPFSLESDEVEMIGVDFVARGGGNATAVCNSQRKPRSRSNDRGATERKSSGEKEKDLDQIEKIEDILSREDEELISTLTAKSNAIRILLSRIKLLSIYLEKLPTYNTSKTSLQMSESMGNKHTVANHIVLRSIQALLSRLALLVPADGTSFQQEMISEQNDGVKEAGMKYSIIQSKSPHKNSNNWGGSSKPGALGAGDLF
ncbi:putative COP9 signalosome subunit 6 [Blumeria hordei DH14]|uniref:COP9 signalosome complex subunit 6 n=1 Tax=Blumeria graminis f. sp. hordei (strain DH14) TaxID=546991 RepID=N1JII3_BLUG1|nr:putative COP9 signalosome subunit 6 [Blumeria hordei DH14]